MNILILFIIMGICSIIANYINDKLVEKDINWTRTIFLFLGEIYMILIMSLL